VQIARRTVVDHLDVVSGSGLSDPVAAGLVTVGALDLGSGLLCKSEGREGGSRQSRARPRAERRRGRTEDLLDVGPGGVRSSGHERGTVSGTLLTTRDSGSDEKEALSLELVGSSDGVGVVRVSTVDDDVSLLEEGGELLNESVNGLSGLDEDCRCKGGR
jgi:hypothetical protein